MAPKPRLDRAAVIAAARDIVDASGPDCLTLTALAAALGIRTPSLYSHVDGLPGLHRDLALLGYRELATSLTNATIGKSRDDAVLSLATAYRRFVLAHPGLYELMLRAARAGHAPDPELDAAGQHCVDIVLAVLASYGLSGDNALHAVRALRSAMHGFATLEAAGNFGLPLDVEESFRRLMRGQIEALHRAPVCSDAVTG